MRLINCSYLLFLVFLFTQCKKDEAPQENLTEEEKRQQELEEANEEIYFVSSLSSFAFERENSWLIIHDTNGNLIDHRSFSDEYPLEFKAEKGTIPERLTITLLNIRYESSGSISYYLTSRTDIKKNSSWYEDIGKEDSNISYSGVFYLDIKNIPGVKSVNIFTTDGKLSQISYNLKTEGDGSKTLELDRVPLDSGNEYIISILDVNGDLKYIKLIPSSNLEQLEVDYQEFLAYDSYLEMELPLDNLFYSQGYTDNNYYTHVGFGENGLSYNDNDLVNNIAKVGYLNSFKKFKTGLSVGIGEFEYGYIKTGSKMEAIALPVMPSIEIIGGTATNFKFTSNKNYKFEESYWVSNENIVNSVSGFTTLRMNSTGDNGHLLGELPAEIIEKHPSLSLEGLKLRTLKIYTKSSTYDEFIDTTTRTFEDNREGETEYFFWKYFLID